MNSFISRLSRLNWRACLLVAAPFGVALLLKAVVASPAYTLLDSDEAIFLLMARHILQGERPLFFYGEAYGGATDSYLTALAFQLFGQSIQAARWVQHLIYLAGMLFSYLLARRIFPTDRLAPLVVLWLMALPPLLMTTWTVPAVRYAIVIGLGSLISYLGHRLLKEDADRLGTWLLFGAVCGLAFWTFGILITFMLPVFLLILKDFRRNRLGHYLLAALLFFLSSVPWWLQLQEGLSVLASSELVETPPLYFRLFAYAALALPGFFGLREPWAPEIVWPAAAPLVLGFYLVALIYTGQRLRGRAEAGPPFERTGLHLLAWQVGLWHLFYFATRFSLDATGRYMLPLYPPLFMAVAFLLARLWRWRRAAALGLLVALLAFNLAGHARAIQRVPPGITAQMNPALWLGNQADQALIDFVATQGGRGYSHHWISYKIAYLSDETVILASLLPFRPDLAWNPRDDRYAPYRATVEASPNPVYVTHREPNLAAYLPAAFEQAGVSYLTKEIGPYRVYYDLSRPITPQELGLGPGSRGAK